MKFFKYGIAGMLLVSTAAFSAEPAMGWYAGIMAGASYSPSVDFVISNPFLLSTFPFPQRHELDYNLGANGGAQLGYRCKKFRFEGELNVNSAPYKQILIGPFNLTRNQNIFGFKMRGNTTSVAGLFNVYYEFYDEEYSETTWVPYVGLGIGYAYVRNTLKLYYFGSQLNSFNDSSSDSEPAAQAIVGINYFFNDNISLGSDLRYMATQTINTYNSRFSSASWNLVLNFSFDQPAYY